MRGKLLEGHERLHHVRIIPAHAGQTTSRAADTVPGTDHPRACGANPDSYAWMFNSTGSSPRMRGKRRLLKRLQQKPRIIPAHAGQTATANSNLAQATDHPRACGANQAAGLNAGILGGSSPRMRGKHGYLTGHGFLLRIIPAHAGQTTRRSGSPT